MGSIVINEDSMEIAVVGGGIVGLILTAGLVHRNIKVKLYEQARGFREIGAGIAFTANAIKCMEIINPSIVTALRSGGSVPTSADKNDPNDYLRWTDGFSARDEGKDLLYKIDAGYRGFEGCRRDQFLEALVKIIPEGTISLRKRLEGVQQSDQLTMSFNDDTRAEADASKSYLDWSLFMVDRADLLTVKSSPVTGSSPKSGNSCSARQIQHPTHATPTRSHIVL